MKRLFYEKRRMKNDKRRRRKTKDKRKREEDGERERAPPKAGAVCRRHPFGRHDKESSSLAPPDKTQNPQLTTQNPLCNPCNPWTERHVVIWLTACKFIYTKSLCFHYFFNNSKSFFTFLRATITGGTLSS